MPANPNFTLQDRLRSLIAASAYFTAITPAPPILTEQIADLAYQVEQVVVPLGFGVVVTTADGKSQENSYEALTSDEDLNISITHNPTTIPGLNILDAQWAVIQAIHGQTVQATPPHALTERDYFRVTGHQRRHDGPPGCVVREVHVLAGLRLL